MKTEITDRILAILKGNPTKGPELEKSLRELLGISTADLEAKSKQDDIAGKVAEALAAHLGMEKVHPPEDQEKAILSSLYPSMDLPEIPVEENEDKPVTDLLYPSLRIDS